MHSDDERVFLTSSSKNSTSVDIWFLLNLMVVVHLRNRRKVNGLYKKPVFLVRPQSNNICMQHMVLFS